MTNLANDDAICTGYVNKEYIFDGQDGKQTLRTLLTGEANYHFMFDPSWEAGCPHYSFWVDNFN
ncbi:MAG TPA: DUF899 family protein, partial [Nitrososphaeraceae archaeon]|nr:DUF899 family protein [Nitrososphaeraceae archaeon]